MVWLGSKPNKKILDSVNTWKKTTGMKVDLITKITAPNPIEKSELKLARSWAQTADIVRLSPFEISSGWYLDIDCSPGKKKLPEVTKTTFFLTDSRTIGNGVFYFNSQKSLMDIWIQQLKKGLGDTSRPISDCTGPGALTRAIYLYAFDFGGEECAKNINLGRNSDFHHWPIHLVPGSSLLKRLARGRYITHFADASWVELAGPKPNLDPLKTLRQFLWLIRI